jgi:hypothetical protein
MRTELQTADGPMKRLLKAYSKLSEQDIFEDWGLKFGYNTGDATGLVKSSFVWRMTSWQYFWLVFQDVLLGLVKGFRLCRWSRLDFNCNFLASFCFLLCN